MTTGQPIRFPSDRNKYNNEFNEALQLQISLNQTNLEANRLYKETGQLPASTQMMDTRSNEEKLMDIHSLKQSIISDLRPIAEPMFASSVIQGVIDSPLNINNSLFRYLAQNASVFAQTLSKKYKFGIAGDANDVAIMVQFLEDAYNKTKNTFQSIKGYINSNTNEGNKSRSNILSANDTDNLITELKDILKRLEGMQMTMGNYSINTVNNIHTISDLIVDILQFLPSSDQMKEIIDLITAQQEETWNPRIGNPYDPRILAFGQLTPNGIATAVLKILSSSLPKLSSVQTIIDRLFRAIAQQDNRIIDQSTNALVNLFANFNTPENRAIMTQFKDEYINRANTIIQRQARQNEINYADQMRINNAEEAADKKSQRVYVINPANDPVNVSDVNVLGAMAPAPAPPVLQQGALIQPRNPAPLPPAGGPVIQAGAPVRANGGQMDQRQWTNYVGQMVMALGPANLDALYRGIPNDPNLRNIDPIRFRFGVQGATDAEKQQACIQALVLNFGNANYGPHAGVGNILHNRALGLGLGKKEKKGRGLYSPFGDSEINHKNLENNILTIRRKSKTNYMDLPSKHISKHMKNIIHNIVGGKIANYEDLHNLNDEEKNYLHKVISKSNLHDRLSVPAPSKDQADKDNHQWEVMRGEIMAGNDSHELVKKFKILTMKLTRQGLLPKNEVMDLFEDLVNLGY
jgi:hypothetical protein